MNRLNPITDKLRRATMIVLVAWLLAGVAGCTAFRPQPTKKDAPRTVEQWMAQPRLQP